MLLSPESPIPLRIGDTYIGSILRSSNGSCGPPPDRGYTKEEENLDGVYSGRVGVEGVGDRGHGGGCRIRPRNNDLF